MKECTFFPCLSSVEDTILLTQTQQEILYQLTKRHRSLPVYRGDYWSCYDCGFCCEDLETMAQHIRLRHRPVAIN